MSWPGRPGPSLALVPSFTTPRGGYRSKSPRLSTKEVLESARGEVRKGRPPPAPTSSSLSADARAMLARCNSDMPPESGGFGSKVTTDGSQLVTIFPGTSVPSRLQLTDEELEQRRIANIVNQGDEASLSCLSDILKQTEKVMGQCEEKMEKGAEQAKKLAKEMSEREPESHRPGIRVKRSRRRRKSPRSTPGGTSGRGASDADDIAESGDESETASQGSSFDGDDGDDTRSRSSRHLPMPVAQGSEELFRRRPSTADKEV